MHGRVDVARRWVPHRCLLMHPSQVKMADYNNVKGSMSAAARKAGGSLAVRDLHTLIKPNQIISSENMTTAFVVVSKFAVKDWTDSYEKMCNFVVPRSSKVIAEEGDYTLVSVVLFKVRGKLQTSPSSLPFPFPSLCHGALQSNPDLFCPLLTESPG
jgi:hypothetical protein